jgi:hypothetical protein
MCVCVCECVSVRVCECGGREGSSGGGWNGGVVRKAETRAMLKAVGGACG